MPRPTLRHLDTGPGEPAANMAMDEALLHSLDQPATLRFYSWKPAGLSLGYFQSSRAFADTPGGHVLVRRLTGGGAIYHDEEITFSLQLDATLLDREIADSYARIHGAIAAALASCGVDHQHLDQCPPCDARGTSPWCFADPVAQDLLSPGGGKLLGSAQRRLRRPKPRVLHHGSLVWRPSTATPFTGSVIEGGSTALRRTELKAAMAEELARALRLSLRPDEPSATERERADELRQRRYADPAFTLRR